MAKEGDNPQMAVDRLAMLIDNTISAVPNAIMLVALVIPTNQMGRESSFDQELRTVAYQNLIPGVVAVRA